LLLLKLLLVLLLLVQLRFCVSRHLASLLLLFIVHR
jgi:hypothetical protein